MTSHFIRTICTLDRETGIPADVIVNTMHWEADTTDDGGPNDISNQWDGLFDRIEDLYRQLIFGGATVLTPVLFGPMLGNNLTIRAYDLAEPEPRVPVNERIVTWTNLDNLTGTPLPAESALCVSLHADRASGDISARRRGRVYLGPLRNDVVTWTNGQGDMVVNSTKRQQVLDLFAATARGGTEQAFRLAIYSDRTRIGGATLDESFNDVTSVSMDNALDTQRRRGKEATTRVTVAIP